MCLGNIENVTYGSDVHCWMENVRVLMVRHSVTRIFMLLTLLLHVALDVKLLVTYLKILLRKDHEMIHEAAEKNCQTFFASKGKNVLRNSLQIASSRVIRLIKGRSYV